ncbi:hypothetical protein OH768_44480 [Streptomyces sp. NBC_01622]|uniref:hypothetical protein n=1 Tax=Streptomyces sp. NBC_01622 TaxID=2975903 RepID=UPI0038694D20|nr:hypothetical protein OH768_44480 [Streptomyces sp. NBC_01622]
MEIHGNVWKLGDGIGATDLVPARYDKIGMRRDWAQCASHLLEDVEPDFASSVRKGDVLVAGSNFGSGHAHYFGAAINACLTAGVGAAFAQSINGMFFRAATDLGLVSWTYGELAEAVQTGDEIRIDLDTGEFRNETTGRELRLTPPPELIRSIFRAGGSTPWAVQTVRGATTRA